jgi:2-methylisocitrate lyase-like PEP mutase family enzyme
MRPTTRLRELLARPGHRVVPFAHDALSARLIEAAGFEAAGISGSGLAMSLLGLPDVGWVTQTEAVDQARNIAAAVNLPVFVDADEGYGNAIHVMRTVRQFEAAGLAGLILEDQETPKRYGNAGDKRVVGRDEMCLRVQAACEARRDPDFVLIARTDARAGYGLDEAIERGRLYVQAGADAVFVEAPQSVEELRAIAAAVPGPLVVSLVEGGKTPLLPADELGALGYKVVAFSTTLGRAAAWTMQRALAEIKAAGTTAGLLDQMITPQQRNQLLGLDAVRELERRFLPAEARAQRADGGKGESA